MCEHYHHASAGRCVCVLWVCVGELSAPCCVDDCEGEQRWWGHFNERPGLYTTGLLPLTGTLRHTHTPSTSSGCSLALCPYIMKGISDGFQQGIHLGWFHTHTNILTIVRTHTHTHTSLNYKVSFTSLELFKELENLSFVSHQFTRDCFGTRAIAP